MNSAAAPSSPPDPPPSPVEREVARIRALTQARRHQEALSAAEALRAQVPENRDVLFLVASNQRFLNRISEALTTLAHLEQHHPRFSRLFQERGHCYVVLHDAPAAIDAFLRGVNLNPALPASWSMLEGLYRLIGDTKNAATAAAHVSTLIGLPPEVVRAGSLFSDGDLIPAEKIVRAFLLKHGDDIEAMRLLARIGIERDVLDDAELLLETVLKLAPDYRAARADYARVLTERHKYLQAREEIETLLKLEPDNPDYLGRYAAASVGLGEHEPAIKLYRRLLAEAQAKGTPTADLYLWIAHSLKTIGLQTEAIEFYHAAAAERPSFGDAWWSLANLKTYQFPAAEIGIMTAQEAATSTSTLDRYHLCFALGKALEDQGEYAQSWTYYERGNALKCAEIRYRPEITEINTRCQIEVCTQEFFAARHNCGVPDPDPIFILGLPRSGSTLLEQILASHSQVEGTQELSDIQRIALELRGRAADLEQSALPGNTHAAVG